MKIYVEIYIFRTMLLEYKDSYAEQIAQLIDPLHYCDFTPTLVQIIAWCAQATTITWINIDQGPWCYAALPGHNELKW